MNDEPSDDAARLRSALHENRPADLPHSERPACFLVEAVEVKASLDYVAVKLDVFQFMMSRQTARSLRDRLVDQLRMIDIVAND